MKKTVPIAIAFVVAFTALLSYLSGRDRAHRAVDREPVEPCRRIVSLAPSITESLFALGLGERVVGVTRHCDYPALARTKEIVGGYATPNYELIYNLEPDIVFLLDLHNAAEAHLGRLDIKTQVVTAKSTADVLRSIGSIGGICRVEAPAEQLVQSIEHRLSLLRQRLVGRDRPRVLMSIGRSMGSNSIKDVFVAGENSFFDDVISLAGGRNAIGQSPAVYPRLSAEGVLALNPDVIIDLVVDREEKALDEADVLEQWQSVKQVSAVQSGRVHVLGQDYVVVPGPRFVQLIEQLAGLFHPALDWR